MTAEPLPSRREQILATAAELFAARGFHGVSVVDIGAACGISGPALYKHFASKDAVLAEMLIEISERLLAVGTERSQAAGDARAALAALVDWHVSFALADRALIVVQERDWESLPGSRGACLGPIDFAGPVGRPRARGHPRRHLDGPAPQTPPAAQPIGRRW